MTHIQWTPYSIRARAFFESYHTLWGKITSNKLISVKIRLQKVVMGEIYTQNVKENFKKCSCFDTIGVPLHISHPTHPSIDLTE